MREIISVFPFILTIVFLHHDLAKLKPAWFCSRCSVVSDSSDVEIKQFNELSSSIHFVLLFFYL